MQGLGAAERELLCACLALFDESTLMARLLAWAEKGKRVVFEDASDAGKAVAGLKVAQDNWMQDSGCSDEQLRGLLWIRLREALALPPRLSACRKGALAAGDDVAAALISALDPPSTVKSGRRWLAARGWLEQEEPAVALEDIVVPVLDEFLEASLDQEDAKVNSGDRRKLLEGALKRMTRLDAAEKQPILDAMEVNSANDRAALTIVLTGAGLASFGTAVNLAGFSAYILAAKASAFIPLVSGPGLVSFVSVLSNPITIIAGTAAVSSLAHSRAKRQVGATISARIVAMLVLSGLRSDAGAARRLVNGFGQIENIEAAEIRGVNSTVLDNYRKEWRLVRGAGRRQEKSVDVAVEQAMQRPIADILTSKNPARRDELINSMALSGLTLGDLLYSAGAIDPTVLKAADFAHVANLSGRLEFGEFANVFLTADGVSLQGSLSRLEGYVAEHAVAAQLTAAGHQVDFPGSSNNAGWDLLVDGQPFQVKFREDVAGIKEHFDQFDFPVIANIELAGRIPEEFADRVFFLEGLGNETVAAVTERSLAAGDALMDPNIPALAFLVSVSRGAINVHRGRATPLQAVEQVMMDGTVRVGLATAGGIGGPVLGLVLFGPAGAWVFGIGAPIIAQSFTTRLTGKLDWWFQPPEKRKWRADCEQKLDALTETIESGLEAKREQLLAKIRRCPGNDAGRYLRWRLWDEVRYLEEIGSRLGTTGSSRQVSPEARLSKILRLVSMTSLHPVVFQLELLQATESIQLKPGLVDELRKIGEGEAAESVRTGALRLAAWFDDADKKTGLTRGINDLFGKISERGPSTRK